MEITKWLQPITLDGKFVKLVPLTFEHKNELLQAANDGKLWELWFTSVPSLENIDQYLFLANQQFEQDTSLPFAVIDKRRNTVIGTTRFLNANSKSKRLEIGYTWYAKSAQKTGINKECKLLLLSYAFEKLDCIAVEFRTHFHNENSRRAIASIGAKQDGILRNHTIDKVGNIRDTVVFSIISSEWKVVKCRLEFKLKQYLS